MSITSDHLGKFVSFNLYPASILGSSYERVKVAAILDADSASSIADVASLHANVYPTLPQGSPSRYMDYLYAKIIHPNGTVGVVGLPWIDGEITIHENIAIRVNIENASMSDIERVRKALIASGFNDFTISKVES